MILAISFSNEEKTNTVKNKAVTEHVVNRSLKSLSIPTFRDVFARRCRRLPDPSDLMKAKYFVLEALPGLTMIKDDVLLSN